MVDYFNFAQNQQIKRYQQELVQEMRTANIMEQQRIAAEMAKEQCPYCRERIQDYAEICSSCRNTLSWSEVTDPLTNFTYFGVCKPGQEQSLNQKLWQLHLERRLILEGQTRRQRLSRIGTIVKLIVALGAIFWIGSFIYTYIGNMK